MSQTATPSKPAAEQNEALNAGDDAQKPVHDKDEFFKEAGVSDAPIPPGQRLVKREERIEYRDQDGNLLDEEQVKALEGKVEFKTRYETRTRVLDEYGNEKGENVVAPPHPDVEGVDSQTVKGDESVPPAKESVEGDREEKAKMPKPASEKKEASIQSQ